MIASLRWLYLTRKSNGITSKKCFSTTQQKYSELMMMPLMPCKGGTQTFILTTTLMLVWLTVMMAVWWCFVGKFIHFALPLHLQYQIRLSNDNNYGIIKSRVRSKPLFTAYSVAILHENKYTVFDKQFLWGVIFTECRLQIK